MRKVIILLPFVLLLFTNCSKREDELSNELFVGTWNWKSTTFYEPPSTETPASTGIVRKMQLLENYHYSITENDVVKSEGNYSIQKGTTNTDHTEQKYLVFSNNGELIIVSVDASKLILKTDGYDGATYEYQK
ncbi:hypothetical protein J4771_00020 [Candidatus Kaistella beijingensis]|uniref:hypothetical protein n=1 Tax=Candidatus Kaistella beijingensis TaxID=2820270 RepID=UPI001CC5797C|nr:hypothetical protein [Candidatus Kaistella beijingensis]UBB89777.1 hypothetical protein J4771_00020 [Candidatus Kaistella beijingensis]